MDFSRTLEEYWEHLMEALERLWEAEICERIHKCEYLRTRMGHLGFEVREDGVHGSSKNVKVVIKCLKS